jgi:integrase/recombinase XerD
MKIPEYRSSLGKQIRIFVEQKRAVGHPYVSSASILLDFDTMLANEFPETDCISKKICDSWINRKKSNPKSLSHNITAVRQLAKYLSGLEIPVYIIPDRISAGREKFEPHIFTDGEKTAFFASIDQCLWRKVSPYRCYVAPMIFRLIYCCGMRSSEARMLKTCDIDLTTGKIIIRESKGWRARVIYVSPDLLENLTEYNTIIERHLPERKAFFPNKDGNFYSENILDGWFHEFWDLLPEASAVTGSSPRVHDWRHTHLTDRLNLWVQEGRNINALYVYLSEYAGHSNFSDTDYYLHLIPSFYPELEKRMAPVNEYILPEVPYGG